MPDSIQISFFKIYLREIVEQMAAKYKEAGRGLETLIVKKAKQATRAIMDKFDEIEKMVKTSINSIE